MGLRLLGDTCDVSACAEAFTLASRRFCHGNAFRGNGPKRRLWRGLQLNSTFGVCVRIQSRPVRCKQPYTPTVLFPLQLSSGYRRVSKRLRRCLANGINRSATIDSKSSQFSSDLVIQGMNAEIK
jgi:hypothetical protein